MSKPALGRSIRVQTTLLEGDRPLYDRDHGQTSRSFDYRLDDFERWDATGVMLFSGIVGLSSPS